MFTTAIATELAAGSFCSRTIAKARTIAEAQAPWSMRTGTSAQSGRRGPKTTAASASPAIAAQASMGSRRRPRRSEIQPTSGAPMPQPAKISEVMAAAVVRGSS